MKERKNKNNTNNFEAQLLSNLILTKKQISNISNIQQTNKKNLPDIFGNIGSRKGNFCNEGFLHTLSGIPYQEDVNNIMICPGWKVMEVFSNNWVFQMKRILEPYYAKKWVLDSFHWWSRVWEYPWVFTQIKFLTPPSGHVLDLGCGVSFFPYLVQGYLTNINGSLIASDYNSNFVTIYNDMNDQSKQSHKVTFTSMDARCSTCPDFVSESYDTIYCVSVLEHTDNYENVIKNVVRLLKPGGFFIMTIDISLERGHSTRKIRLRAANNLIKMIASYMDETNNITSISVPREPLLPKYVFDDSGRTHWVPKWWHRQINLTVSCHVFQKRV